MGIGTWKLVFPESTCYYVFSDGDSKQKVLVTVLFSLMTIFLVSGIASTNCIKEKWEFLQS